jgi:hypothetical protein
MKLRRDREAQETLNVQRSTSNIQLGNLRRTSRPEGERQTMKLTMDREADALYLDLDESPAADSEEISPE